jgi:hypothetical protein
MISTASMRPRAPLPESTLRHQRRSLLLAACLIAACYPIDFVQPNTAATVVIRAAWIAVALLAAWAQQRDRPHLAVGAGHLAGLATGAAVTSIIALTGGTRSVFEGMFLATPFAVLVALPELPTAAAICGGVSVVGGFLVRRAEGQSAFELAAWCIVSTVMAVLAVYGTVMTRRLFRAEVESALERARAVEALVESERLRADAEALAEAGRVAAGVVHEVNSPLAALRTNLRSLARGAVEPGEREEVLADAVEGVERITGVISALGRSIHPTSRRPPPGALAQADPFAGPGVVRAAGRHGPGGDDQG